MKRIAALTLIVLSLTTVVSRSQQQPNNVKEFMKLKLTHSQNLLEGLVKEDYDMVAKNSQAMSLLSQAATWQVLQTPEYLQHSVEFRRAADAVTKAAKEKNIDGATLGYMDMTLKCVNCHKYVRGTRIASIDGPALGAIAE